MLRAEHVDVRFGGVRALADAAIEANASQITGLIGPNGAGKTTLFNVLTGLQKPARGKVFLDGRDITGLGPRARASLGIARTFQRLELFGSLTVLENVMVPIEARQRFGRRKQCRAVAEGLLDRVGISETADRRADSVPTGIGRLVELARSLASDPQVLLLDEASSGLDSDESKHFGELLSGLAGDGMAILLVEHDIELVMSVCQEIHVLDFGEVIARGTPSEVSGNRRVRAAYLGTDESGVATTAVANDGRMP